MGYMKFKTAPAYNRQNRELNVNREKLLITNVVAMQAGVEALGHGVMADMKTLQMVKRLGNQRKAGVRGNFGHIGMSENSMGRKTHMNRNFRVIDDRLVTDIYLMPEADLSPVYPQPVTPYLLEMAENRPAEIAMSAVIGADTVWTLEDGTELYTDKRDAEKWEGVATDDKGKPVNALTDLPILRPQTFPFLDFVSEGALTHDGLFGVNLFSGTSGVYAEQAFDLLDSWREEYDIPLNQVPVKLYQVLSKYLAARGLTSNLEDLLMAAKRTTSNRPLMKALEEAQVIATPDDFEDDEFDGEDEEDDAENATPDVLDEAIAEMAETPDEAVEPAVAASAILAGRIEALEARVEKLVTLATALVKRQRKLDNQLNGERTVLGKVPKTRPPQSFANHQPMSLSQDELYADGLMAEIGAALEDDPVQFSIAQRNRRHNALNGKK